MNKKELRKFLTMIAECAPTGSFEIYLNLSKKDIDKLKHQMKIDSPSDAKKALAQLDKEECDADTQRAAARVAQEAAEKRLDEQQNQSRAARASKLKTPIKPYNPKSIMEKKSKESKWEIPIPEKGDQETANRQFIHDVTNRGLTFTRDKYGCTINDIKSAMKRLNVKVNWDLVPR